MIAGLRKFYHGKRVFLTGHTGFKGSWLALWLRELGAEVVAYSLPPENVRGNHFSALGLEGAIESHYGNICDFEELHLALKSSRAEIVFHLAAQALVRRSYREPISTFASNVMGTVHLFEAIRLTPTVRAVVNVTTDKCYENQEWVWPYREVDALGGSDPYSSSKACAELVTTAYRRSFFQHQNVALASARAGNVIGGGDFAEDRIIPDIVEALGKGEPVVLRSPNSVRPWQHVLDALFGYLLLGVKLSGPGNDRYSGAYNFSPARPENVTVEHITQTFIGAMGRGAYEIAPQGAELHEATMLKLDPSKAMAELNWRPTMDTNQAVRLTAEWFAEYLKNPADAKAISRQQLNQVMTLIEHGYEDVQRHA